MTPIQIRIACAELAGYMEGTWGAPGMRQWIITGTEQSGIPLVYRNQPLYYYELPPFEESLNLLRWLELRIINTPELVNQIEATTWEVLEASREDAMATLFDACNMTALQKAEILLRVLGIWDTYGGLD